MLQMFYEARRNRYIMFSALNVGKKVRGVTTLTNAVSLSRPGNLDHPPEFLGYIPGNY